MTLGFWSFSYISRSRRGGGNVKICRIDFRHFHRPLAPLLVVHAQLFVCTHMGSLACCILRAACSSATRAKQQPFEHSSIRWAVARQKMASPPEHS
jgi:hypothetical protein